ncbi:AAA-like domain-containing protein [Trichocoleus sp. FACHB-262]|uniref:AAA-like domain-containing protein n=1 Tax=Trichocoleus sp. FACHB-262 TaxID=2692869 RepID=UPI0016891109|nr:AAA-like domain-containing protein [Trichocoleus sp. FACHB-262]MBD2124598.1 AAA-like domain-containing protein [Trichocoleus sp. FACHB-262]
MISPRRHKKTILFLAANPKASTPLRLGEEVNEIDEGLQRSKQRNKFQLEQKWAVTPREMRRAVLELEPQIVHFSGHGVGEGGLALEDELGQVKLVSAKALASLFDLFKEQVECVVLNACYSELQANAIARHIPYVIGMSQEVGDQAAREFAVGFYDALASGRSIEFAYNYGCTSISMEGIPEELTPVLKKQSEILSEPEPVQEVNEGSEACPLIALSASRSLKMVSSYFLETPEGSVSLKSPLYVERPPIESSCYQEILKPGALIRVKAPRQMGKSSLMQRILYQAEQQGHRVVYLNLQSVDSEFLNNIDQFLQWFCASVANELNLDDRLSELWKGVLGSKNKCTNYFQRYLFATLNEPLTLGLDEVDQVFQHLEVAQDFFGLLRFWHEKSKNDATWQKFRLVIAHSREVYIPLNINQSPFNVGLPIELPELNQTQVSDLVQRHGLGWSSSEIDQLRSVVDGHPYLVRRALYEIAKGNLTLEKFLAIAPTEEGLYSDHLRRHLENLRNDPQLEAAMKQVVMAEGPVRIESSLGFKLHSMGLVERRGNDVLPLCNLYQIYFRDRLGVG